jgi:hypothetical protein
MEQSITEFGTPVRERRATMRNMAEDTDDPDGSLETQELLSQFKRTQIESNRDFLEQMRRLLMQEDGAAAHSIKPFDWMAAKPSQHLHPVGSAIFPYLMSDTHSP